jgi:ribosomal protein L11 methyltransferase
MNQLELSIEKTKLAPDEVEMLIAFLADAGFESFAEEDIFLKAFCPVESMKSDIPQLLGSFSKGGIAELEFFIRIIVEKNWNEQWEKNFSPIEIENRILIKAPFHKNPNLEYTVIIEPKMSFGTGHHETTRLMLRELLQAEISGKEVLDMGCGTGVLGIIAKMMGASYLLAVDNDEWAFQNAYENFQRNNILQPWDVFPGDCSVLEGHTFHVILANINRNILLNDLPEYFKVLKDNGTLIISGILSVDKDVLLAKAKECGFTFVSSFYENNWISLNLRK